MTSQLSLSSTGYCLAHSGAEYLVSQPSSGACSVLVGTYQYEWFNPATNKIVSSGIMLLPADNHSFTPSFRGDFVLHLRAASRSGR
jgi:hypothetical protein